MSRTTPSLVCLALVLLVAAGVAAANGLLTGPPVEIAVNGGPIVNGPAVAQTSPAVPGTPATPSAPMGTATTAVPSTGAPVPTGAGGDTATAPAALAIDEIVSLTRAVDTGTPAVNAFTVPAGRILVITDVLITNTSVTPVCGASISPGVTSPSVAPTPTAATATTPAPSAEAGTGVLCVPAQSSLNVGLTTGLEFAAGQSVVLANVPASASPTGGLLNFHLRGFLARATAG